MAIAIGVGIHAIVHLSCDFPRILHASPAKYEALKPYFGVEQPASYWHFVKSVEGVTGIIMVVLMAIAFTLATPWFRRNRVNLPLPSPQIDRYIHLMPIVNKAFNRIFSIGFLKARAPL